MTKNRTKKNSDLELLRSLPVSKNKILIAAVLVTIMGVMWCRLLLSGKSGKGGVAAVNAVTAGQNNATAAQADDDITISYIELPVIEGRNDVLTRDIFTTTNWTAFKAAEGATGKTDPGHNIGEETITAADIEKVERLVSLTGIIGSGHSGEFEAFIDNRLVSVGSKTGVEYNNRLLELVVTEIHKNRIVLRWEEFTLNVKMPRAD